MNVRYVALLLVMLVLASGCAEPGADQAEPLGDKPTEGTPDGKGNQSAYTSGGPAGDFVWESYEALGNVTLRISMRVDTDKPCKLYLEAAGLLREAGPYSHALVWLDGEIVFEQYSSLRDPARVHVRGYDSEPILGAAGVGWNNVSWSEGVSVGDVLNETASRAPLVEVIWVMSDVVPGDFAPDMGNASMRVTMDCPSASEVSFEGSREGWLFDDQSFQDGAGASAAFWSVAHDQRKSFKAVAPRTEVLWRVDGWNMGSFHVKHPEGEYDEAFNGDSWNRFESTAGPYEVRLNDYGGVPNPSNPCPAERNPASCYNGFFDAVIGAFRPLDTLDDL